MTEIPDDVLARMARSQAMLDAEVRVLAPDGVEVNEWDVIKEAAVTNVEYEDGDLHVWLKTTTHVSELVATATHWQPAEYRNHDATTHVSITWSMDPEDQPLVDIEVLEP